MKKKIVAWMIGRMKETTTYAGMFLVAFGGWGLTSTDPHVDQVLHIMSQFAVPVGTFLVAMSQK